MKQTVALAAMGIILAAYGVASAAGGRGNPRLRQPEKVSHVQGFTNNWVLESNFVMARTGAEALDAQSMRLLDSTTMSRWERWRDNVDLYAGQKQYTQDMLAYLKAMTKLLKMHRESRGFVKLREFDFQNMIRKSDYLLALPVTRASLAALLEDQEIAEKIQTILGLYNQERQQFDQKVFTITKN